ncbi:tripartite tricarboxylate transporter substrate binding protein [Bradyrhizobium sp. WD16]|uniref:Bug family tripartite tricarboxylate transporter substrate binding protein n=1 Tax=Bradyrhizobium sp. WD16 TaxID=1521768 RepID=UPI0020A3C4F3|nr:tripartite tricarboxylate transporter substrate binding protein [Bradyrhizobium sp. WD16]UTD27726.1 tripartite tricarboxylate transporter substrate binding protein [Bradyrhizobium sp. WD16]
MISRRHFVAAAMGAAIAPTAGARLARAAETAWPTRPIRLIVPYAAGGGTDFFARLAGATMSAGLGQQIVVENRPGAGTNIGAEAAAKAEPDGYTFLLGDTSTYASNRSLYQKLPYDPQKDLAPVSLTGRFALVLLVNTDKLPVGSVKALIAAARNNSGGIDYASAGVGSPFHLAAELFAQSAGIKINHVPYKGAGPALQDLASGQFGMMFVDFATARSQLNLKGIKAIAVCSPKEFYGLPGVPPVAADIPGFEAWAWQGLSAPARTPPEIIGKLHDAYVKAVNDADTRQKIIAAGIDPLQSTPQEMAQYIAAETAKWEKVIKTAGIKMD